MKIACLQFNPQLGDLDNNLTIADNILSDVDPDGLDLLVLPEMAFSGYSFRSLREVHPFLETTGSGISSLWARSAALRFNCTVVVGYPETADVSHKWPTSPEYYNSAIVVSSEGENVANYRKTHLYYTDETWSLEGPGFFGGHLPGLGQAAIGICMDLNPYKFQTAWDKFEFAYHVLDCDANIVIVSMAWLTQEDGETFTAQPEEPDLSTLTYWVTRLEPIIRDEGTEEIIVVFCNRCGTENTVTYAGTSAVIGIANGEVNVYGLLGRGSKDLLIADTLGPPKAKLVMTPAGGVLQPITSAARPQTSSAKPAETRVRVANVNHRREYEAIYEANHGHPPPQAASQGTRRSSQHDKTAAPSLKLKIPVTSATWTKAKPQGREIPTPQGPSPTPGDRRPTIDGTTSSRSRNTSTPARRPSMSRISTSNLAERSIERRSSRNRTDTATPVGHERRHAASRHRETRQPASPGVEVSHRSRASDRPSSRTTTDKDAVPRSRRGRQPSLQRGQEPPSEPSLLDALRLQDSPVSRRPDASILSSWLEKLPVASSVSGTPAPPFSTMSPGPMGETARHRATQPYAGSDTRDGGTRSQMSKMGNLPTPVRYELGADEKTELFGDDGSAESDRDVPLVLDSRYMRQVHTARHSGRPQPSATRKVAAPGGDESKEASTYENDTLERGTGAIGPSESPSTRLSEIASPDGETAQEPSVTSASSPDEARNPVEKAVLGRWPPAGSGEAKVSGIKAGKRLLPVTRAEVLGEQMAAEDSRPRSVAW